MSKAGSAIVLVVDGLRAGFLGPYGNTLIDSPACNDLSARGQLWENLIADSAELESACWSWWTGRHAASLSRDPPADGAMLAELARAGIQTQLLTDEPKVANHTLARHFQSVECLPPAAISQPARNPEDTAMARIATRVAELLPALPHPFLLWVHAQGARGAWDAPLDLRRRYQEEGDPPPYPHTAAPCLQLDGGVDPDQAFAWLQAYAAQVSIVDMSLGFLVDSVRALRECHPQSPLAFCLTSARGFPLGEHGAVGEQPDAPLQSELLHLPLLWDDGNFERGGFRHLELAQSPDIGITLAEWLLPGLAASSPWGRNLLAASPDIPQLAYSTGAEQRAMRSPNWSLLERDGRSALYAKPDDRWEVNDVARLCPSVVRQLHQQGDEFLRCALANSRASLPPLPHELIRAIE
jgi:hypothetical protein